MSISGPSGTLALLFLEREVLPSAASCRRPDLTCSLLLASPPLYISDSHPAGLGGPPRKVPGHGWLQSISVHQRIDCVWGRRWGGWGGVHSLE